MTAVEAGRRRLVEKSTFSVNLWVTAIRVRFLTEPTRKRNRVFF